MNPIDILKKEHEDIKIELIELEAIMELADINYSNLKHVLEKLCCIWDDHELKEEKIFPIMEKERIKIPVYTMQCEHRDLRTHKEVIKKAINSGSNQKMKEALEKNGRIIIRKLRKHIDDEDEVLYTIALEEFTAEGLKELAESIMS